MEVPKLEEEFFNLKRLSGNCLGHPIRIPRPKKNLKNTFPEQKKFCAQNEEYNPIRPSLTHKSPFVIISTRDY